MQFTSADSEDEYYDARSLDQHLHESCYTKAVQKLGPHKQLDHDLEISLNDKTCEQIADLFSGAIIHSNDFSMLISTNEAYLRDGFEDVHTEKDGFSFPEAMETRWLQNLKICIRREADGGKALRIPFLVPKI